MFFLFRRLRRDFPNWERPVQIGMITALVLLVVTFGFLIVAPQEMRPQILAGLGAIILVTELIVLWGNRGMVSPLTQAQRAYMKGDFEAAVAALEPLRAVGKADVRTLTLLGNTYRQMGELDQSQAVLSEAVDKTQNHHYALYGFGRTLIVRGQYAEGLRYVEQALETGAPPIVRFDLAEALIRLGEPERALEALEQVDVSNDAPRALMKAYWMQRYAGAEPPVVDGASIAFWQAQAERFAETPYGTAVAEEVADLKTILDRR